HTTSGSADRLSYCPSTTLFRSARVPAIPGACPGRHPGIGPLGPGSELREADAAGPPGAGGGWGGAGGGAPPRPPRPRLPHAESRSAEHTSELQSRENLVCRLLL